MRRLNVERVLGYVRVSGAEQGRSGTSLDAQREAIERHCATLGLPSPKIYVEVESAGAEKLERRAELRALLAELRAGDLVIVRSQDRWSRATEWFLSSMREIKARGASFFSIAEQFDPDTPQGRYAATIMAATFEHERELIRGRTVGRRKELRDEGFYVEGLPKLGYRRKSKRDRERGERPKLIVVPEDARTVLDMFSRYAHGASLNDISEYLKVEQPSRHGWDKPTIHGILRSRIYLGEMRDSRGVWIPSHEPIVPRALWDRVQAELERRRKGGRRGTEGARTQQWLGRGLLTCADCGSVMSAVYSPRSATGGYYACGGRLRDRACFALYARVDETDRALAGLVLERLVELRHELAKPAPDEPAPAVDHDAQIERIRQQRAKAIKLAVQELISDAELREQLAELDAQLGRVETHREASARREHMRAPEARREALASVEGLQRLWEVVTVPERREILQRLAKSVRVRHGEAPQIEWYTPEELSE